MFALQCRVSVGQMRLIMSITHSTDIRQMAWRRAAIIRSLTNPHSAMKLYAPFESAARLALIATALGCAATASQAQELWPGTKVGMSTADVSRRIPSAKPLTAPPSGKPWGTCLREAILTLVDVKFNSCFRFIDDKLVNVLARQEDEFVQNASTRANFEKIAAEFRKKYGPPKSMTLESRHAGLFGGATWEGDGVSVEVSSSPSTQITSHLVVVFKKAQ